MGRAGAETFLESAKPTGEWAGGFRTNSQRWNKPFRTFMQFGQSQGSLGTGSGDAGSLGTTVWTGGTPFASVLPVSNPPPQPWSQPGSARVWTRAQLQQNVSAGPPSPEAAAPTWLRSRGSTRFVYKPVYPSIYMLHRMYICWEHARFCRVLLPCVVHSSAPGPCWEGGPQPGRPFPHSHHQPRPVPLPACLCPQFCPCFDRPEAAPDPGHPSNFLYI